MDAPTTPEARSRAFYDRTAPVYDEAMSAPVARALRECFWQRAAAEFRPGSRLFDFGAGSGLDAEHFADLGHRVTAYEPSAGMLALLRTRCAAQIAAGTVSPLGGTFAEVREALAGTPPFDGAICNFAVLSMIPRLGPVFRFLGSVVRPGGRLLISIQNPWYPGDLRRRAFWRALLGFPVRGVLRFPSEETGYTSHWLPSQVRRAARPEFRPAPEPSPPLPCSRPSFGPLRVFRLIVLERA
jgi:SAM-dependent methyltransferase